MAVGSLGVSLVPGVCARALRPRTAWECGACVGGGGSRERAGWFPAVFLQTRQPRRAVNVGRLEGGFACPQVSRASVSWLCSPGRGSLAAAARVWVTVEERMQATRARPTNPLPGAARGQASLP